MNEATVPSRACAPGDPAAATRAERGSGTATSLALTDARLGLAVEARTVEPTRAPHVEPR